jgi:glycosyltransferase involved in cell wall biosynthesis
MRSATGCLRQASSNRRERIALVTPWHPEPVDNGSKQRIRQLITALADTYDIVLITLLSPEQCSIEPLPNVPGVWSQHTIPLAAFEPRSIRALLASFRTIPRSFVATWDSNVASAINAIVERAQVRLALGADLRVLQYLLALPPGIRTLLDEANTSPFLVEPSLRSGLDSVRAYSRQWKYARLLQATARRLDAAIVPSLREAHAYRQLSGSSRVVVIENGAGTLPEPSWQVPAGAQLLYAGSLTYGLNAEAVTYFAQSILPLIERQIPSVGLTVTGASPATVPPAIAHPRVTLTGRLDEVALDTAYRASRACVVPLLSGTGTRIKLLEAMAFGIPVVSTTKGAEGLDIIPGEEYLRADAPADFAAATVRLIRDDAFARAIGARGRERIRRDYTWESRGRQLRELVRECLCSAPLGREG